MNNLNTQAGKMTNYRWVICVMLFFATTINYMDRQVLSLTWVDFIAPEFGWTNNDYGNITSLFSIFYAISMLFAGRFVDWLGTKKGFMWAIGIWSLGACLHAFCGIGTAGIVAGEWTLSFHGAKEAIAAVGIGARVVTVSVTLFVFARLVLAVGEAGNFPAAIKATAEYFPKKARGFATSIFNSGAQIGALVAPLTIPFIAKAWGWEMSFIVIGALGFIWMGFWQFLYKKPETNPKVNEAELAYILQDNEEDKQSQIQAVEEKEEKKLSFAKCFKLKQTWAFAFGKFMTDGVWWFYLFWAPAYLSQVYNMTGTEVAFPIFVLYLITMISIVAAWLPTYFIDKKKMNPYAGRMRAMFIYALFPLLALLAQPLGPISYWFPIVIIGIAGAAHQAWSANLFSTIGDMFPKSAIATITGIGGMMGGVGSFLINKGSGMLFDFTHKTWTKVDGQPLLEKFPEYANEKLPAGFVESLKEAGHTVIDGINSGYMIIFSICAVAYMIGWIIMKILVPKYKAVVVE